jgi:hypothetical protein
MISWAIAHTIKNLHSTGIKNLRIDIEFLVIIGMIADVVIVAFVLSGVADIIKAVNGCG